MVLMWSIYEIIHIWASVVDETEEKGPGNEVGMMIVLPDIQVLRTNKQIKQEEEN